MLSFLPPVNLEMYIFSSRFLHIEELLTNYREQLFQYFLLSALYLQTCKNHCDVGFVVSKPSVEWGGERTLGEMLWKKRQDTIETYFFLCLDKKIYFHKVFIPYEELFLYYSI